VKKKVVRMRKNQAKRHKKGNSTPHYIWGHHAVISALKNKNRKIKKLYVTEKNIPIIEKIDIINEHSFTVLT
jgi:tRNA G18 (ribose-2'-O)-methylase SpoU